MFHQTPLILYSTPWIADDGSAIVFRAIRPDDEPLMVRFHQALSAESVYTRYFNVMTVSRRIAHERLRRICHPNLNDEMVIVAESPIPDGDGREIIGVGRLSELADENAAEMAFIVSDFHQGNGIGTELMQRLINIAKHQKLSRVVAHVLYGNAAMQQLCTAAGMRISDLRLEGEVEAELDL